MTLPTLTLPTYSAISFTSEAEHKAAVYDACLLIVNTYNQTNMLDFYELNGVTSHTFMTFARNVLNQIAEELVPVGKLAQTPCVSSGNVPYLKHEENTPNPQPAPPA